MDHDNQLNSICGKFHQAIQITILAKRRRTDETVDTEQEFGAVQAITPIVRDLKFYRNDGDCEILAGNTLFRIHSNRLLDDAAMLARIFPRNVASNPNGPFTVHDPIVFPERAEDLRAYCWRLYVHFEEIVKQGDPSVVDFSRLLSIYYLANKYQMLRDEVWARNCIVTHCEQAQDADRLFSQCTDFELERLLVMACDAEMESLKKAIGSVWARMLQKNPARSINNVLNLAERLNLRWFQGQLYYAALVRVSCKLDEEDMNSRIAKLGIQPTQHVHLMKGYQALTEFCWIMSALPISKTFGRIHRSCEQEWKKLWTPEIQRERDFDPVGTLLAYTGRVQSCAKSPCSIRICAQVTFDILSDTMEDKFL